MKTNFLCCQAIARVGIDFAKIQKEPKFLSKCEELETYAFWGHKLANIKVSYKTKCSLETN